MGIVLSLIGIVLIIVANYLEEPSLNHSNISISIILMVLGSFFQAVRRIYQEWLLRRIQITSSQCIGLEGFFSLWFIFIFQLLISLIYLILDDKSQAKLFLSNCNPGRSTIIIGLGNINNFTSFDR